MMADFYSPTLKVQEVAGDDEYLSSSTGSFDREDDSMVTPVNGEKGHEGTPRNLMIPQSFSNEKRLQVSTNNNFNRTAGSRKLEKVVSPKQDGSASLKSEGKRSTGRKKFTSLLDAKNAYDTNIEDEIAKIKGVFTNKIMTILKDKVPALSNIGNVSQNHLSPLTAIPPQRLQAIGSRKLDAPKSKPELTSKPTSLQKDAQDDVISEESDTEEAPKISVVRSSKHNKDEPISAKKRDYKISIKTGDLMNGCNINVSNC